MPVIHSPPDEGVKKEDLHPDRMRRFVRHLSAAAIKAEERSVKKHKVRERLEKIKSVSLNKRSTKEMIEGEIGSFESAIHEIIHDEEKILDEQRRETKQINELKSMVEILSRKLIDIGREYASELEDKDRKILELREALASAHIRISESGDERQKKIENIERKIKERPSRLEPVFESADDLANQLAELEQRHEELKKSGKHSKADLDRVKRLIDKHKVVLGIDVKPESAPVLVAKKAVKPVVKKNKTKQKKKK